MGHIINNIDLAKPQNICTAAFLYVIIHNGYI